MPTVFNPLIFPRSFMFTWLNMHDKKHTNLINLQQVKQIMHKQQRFGGGLEYSTANTTRYLKNVSLVLLIIVLLTLQVVSGFFNFFHSIFTYFACVLFLRIPSFAIIMAQTFALFSYHFHHFTIFPNHFTLNPEYSCSNVTTNVTATSPQRNC